MQTLCQKAISNYAEKITSNKKQENVGSDTGLHQTATIRDRNILYENFWYRQFPISIL